MSKFNSIKPKAVSVVNRAGGKAYKQSDEFALTSLMLTSFVKDQFYRTETQTVNELFTLLDKVDPMFAAKLAIYVRDVFGMRSISHVAAGYLSQMKGIPRNFFNKVVVRPDDMLEITAVVNTVFGDKRSNGKMKLPNGMKAGFKKAFDKFDGYQLAKYQNRNKEYGSKKRCL